MMGTRVPSGLSRRGLLAGAIGLSVRSSVSAPAPFSPSDETHAFEISLDVDAPGKCVNRRVLGSNVGWVFGGDNLLTPEGEFAPVMLEMVKKQAPTVLRYPGGTFSDVFHWESPENEHVFTRTKQPTLMDTRRFLELCETVGAEPLITVNMVTGTPQEAARWLAAVNVKGMRSRLTGRPLPPVKFWELGNEPYLKEESRTDINLAPDEFARRVNQFIVALRAVDPKILIGLPLTSDQRGGVPVTPYPGFARRVLGQVDQAFDYVSLHNAYMPFGFGYGMSESALYWGAAAGALTVQSDLAAMTALLSSVRPGRKLPLAITEFSALFSLGRGATDQWIVTPAGAIFLADVLRVFAQSPDVLLATHWSLTANWLFGGIHADGHARPAHEVLRLMGEALQGDLLPARRQSEVAKVRGIGQVAAVDAMPLIEVMATRAATPDPASRTLRLLLINKDPERAAAGIVKLAGRAGNQRVRRAALSVLRARDLFDARDQPQAMTRSESVLPADGRPLRPQLPPHSVALLTIELPPA